MSNNKLLYLSALFVFGSASCADFSAATKDEKKLNYVLRKVGDRLYCSVMRGGEKSGAKQVKDASDYVKSYFDEYGDKFDCTKPVNVASFIHAAAHGDKRMIEDFLERGGCDVNVESPDGGIPIASATFKYNIDTAPVLLAKGAKVTKGGSNSAYAIAEIFSSPIKSREGFMPLAIMENLGIARLRHGSKIDEEGPALIEKVKKMGRDERWQQFEETELQDNPFS